MRFSRKTDYGVILVQALRPTFRDRSFVALSEVARVHYLPLPFLQKLAETLRRGGYLEAKRGPDGGYRLIRDPAEITLQELIEVFEEPKSMRCMHSPQPEKYCPLVPICPTRKTWLALDRKVSNIFRQITLAEF